jgi:hypothetical protein
MSVEMQEDSVSDDFEPLELDEDTPLGELYDRRVKNNQDLTILIEDWHARRGTGKSTLTLKLGAALDRTDEGVIPEKCSLSPQKIVDAYTDQDKGSALVMDEGSTGLSKYRAGSHINKAMRDIITMGRVEEKYLIMNAPAGAQIDSDLRELFDVVIFVQQLGVALVHFVKRKPYSGGMYLDDVQEIQWDTISDSDLNDVYRKLTEEKKKKMRGDGEDFVPKNEVDERVKKAKKNARMEKRDELAASLQNDCGLPATEIEDAFGVKAERLRQLARD